METGLLSEEQIVSLVYLEDDINHNNHHRVGKVEEKPDLNVLYGSSNGQAVGHRDLDGGQDHHAGDVHSDHHFIVLPAVVCGLVNQIHQYGG